MRRSSAEIIIDILRNCSMEPLPLYRLMGISRLSYSQGKFYLGKLVEKGLLKAAESGRKDYVITDEGRKMLKKGRIAEVRKVMEEKP